MKVDRERDSVAIFPVYLQLHGGGKAALGSVKLVSLPPF